MATQRGLALNALLRRVPEDERVGVVRDLVVDPSNSSSEQGVCSLIALLDDFPDGRATSLLEHRLSSLIDEGSLDTVLSVCSQHQWLRDAVSELSNGRIRGATTHEAPGTRDGTLATAAENGSSQPSCRLSVARNLAFFSRSLQQGQQLTCDDEVLGLLPSLLRSKDEAESRAAVVAILAVLASGKYGSSRIVGLVWSQLKELLSGACGDSRIKTGFSFWLRWACIDNAQLHQCFEPAYWELIRDGLRFGDGERRKQCLVILRRSVTLAASGFKGMVARVPNADTQAIIDQYERYCIVTEAILLGRYINQVIECESDLDALAASHAVIQPEWIFVLLSAALHSKLQDSNRKFIGNWIMRSDFLPTTSESYVNFFRTAFLPWATQGSLFTATLRKVDGKLESAHGMRLSNYICTILNGKAANADFVKQMIDAILDQITGRKSGSFAYAHVALLDGLSQASERNRAIVLGPDQLRRLADLAKWTALPEIARDFVFLRCVKLCADSMSRKKEAATDDAVVDAGRRWEHLGKLLEAGPPDGLLSGPIASWEAEPSKRVSAERLALEKCDELQKRLSAERLPDPEEVMSTISDIWADLEYLEHPKDMLIRLSILIASQQLVQLAISSSTVCNYVVDRLQKLQALSKNRVYIISPLICALRDAIYAVPQAADSLGLSEIILAFAEGLPEPTVDIQLEDAASHMVQSIAPHLGAFGYEYYFGDRETVGIAALLDLTSRLKAAGLLEVARSVLDRLMQRWLKQKIPPPTVSPWKSALQLKLMLLCCEQCVVDGDYARQTLQDLHHLLSIEPLPRYRYLLSWMIARIYLRHTSLKEGILLDLGTKDHHSNPKYVASLMKLAVVIARTDGTEEAFASHLCSAFVPLAASSKVIIRHEAQWQVPLLMDYAKAKGWRSVSGCASFVALDDYIRSLERFEQPPLERQLDRFHPVAEHTLTNLVEGLWYGLDNTEVPLCGRTDFVKLQARDGKRKPPASCIPLGDAIRRRQDPSAGDSVVRTIDATTSLSPSKAGESRALQTKGTAYLSADLDLDNKRARNDDLIVIASLIDNPYNLGGLSRISEIFGASELHLQNQNVTGVKDFTNVSVSSHLHIPIFQLSAASVPEYLADKRREGWTTVGIEQTDRSLLLGSEGAEMPNGKVILVLGSEREGIPAVVMAECDVLVEIPQMGITRSLNVQTAAGIVMFELTRQRKLAASSQKGPSSDVDVSVR